MSAQGELGPRISKLYHIPMCILISLTVADALNKETERKGGLGRLYSVSPTLLG